MGEGETYVGACGGKGSVFHFGWLVEGVVGKLLEENVSDVFMEVLSE